MQCEGKRLQNLKRLLLDAFNAIFRPFLYWRVAPGWYLVALFGYAAMWITALVWRGELQSELAKIGLPSAWLPVFLISLFAAVPEQVAWRGFALARLQSRYNALVSSLIVGGMWALWHLPLLLNTDNVMSMYPIIPYFLNVIALSVVYAWIFNSTRGSLLIVTIFHAASNTVGPFAGMEQAWMVGLVAATLVLVFGPAHLCRPGIRMEQADIPPISVQAD